MNLARRVNRLLQRSAACALGPLALFAAAPAAPGAPPPPANDRVFSLAETSTCRSVDGIVLHNTGARNGNVVTVHHEGVNNAGQRISDDDRYIFDPRKQRWHVMSFTGLDADAPPWLEASWTVQGADKDDRRWRMFVEALPNGDYRESLSYVNANGVSVLASLLRCTPGTTPPPADACIIEQLPAVTLDAPPIDPTWLPPKAPTGVVHVIVSLNERSQIVGTRVQSSSSTFLNDAALKAANAATYRTRIVNCKPLAGDYIFTVSFVR